LLKAAGSIPHKGGKRFEIDSVEYRLLADWIAFGAPGPSSGDPRIERIEIEPKQVGLENGASQQMRVTASFSDGRKEDVTRWAKYTAANATVTQVDEEGMVKVVGSGEGPITAWYLSRIAIGTIRQSGTAKLYR